MADVVKAPVHHVDTAKGETHVGQTPAQKVPQLCGRISVEDRRCKSEPDL